MYCSLQDARDSNIFQVYVLFLSSRQAAEVCQPASFAR